MSGKTPIPKLARDNLESVHDAIKQNLDSITGQGRNVVKLKPLPAGATDEEMRERLNELLERIQ